MYRENIVSELLEWIEHNLDQPLTLDTIAAKSGYSKWHLQRLFKSFTGYRLGTYTRERRLTMAAQELRGTSFSVLRIAEKYQFDSQQTFTRTFKKHFNMTPAVYRRSEDQSNYGFCPPYVLELEPPQPVSAPATVSVAPSVANKETVAMKEGLGRTLYCQNASWPQWLPGSFMGEGRSAKSEVSSKT
ncbi:helix-turn-helix domain-containing protein [Rouxiella sp. Mn2063]|uniref:helix-turn-helix domain-containing protein n=1 Tax=Rouxiella sp. Mn2063 TaxID=3395262 RepID=UPI003BC5834D